MKVCITWDVFSYRYMYSHNICNVHKKGKHEVTIKSNEADANIDVCCCFFSLLSYILTSHHTIPTYYDFLYFLSSFRACLLLYMFKKFCFLFFDAFFKSYVNTQKYENTCKIWHINATFITQIWWCVTLSCLCCMLLHAGKRIFYLLLCIYLLKILNCHLFYRDEICDYMNNKIFEIPTRRHLRYAVLGVAWNENESIFYIYTKKKCMNDVALYYYYESDDMIIIFNLHFITLCCCYTAKKKLSPIHGIHSFGT